MEKVLYQVTNKKALSLKDLKELGIDGLYVNNTVSKDLARLKKEAKSNNLEVISAKEFPFNQELATTILNELTHSSAKKFTFVSKVENELDNQKINGLENNTFADQLILFQALALMSLLPGQLLIPAGLEGKRDSPSWDKLKGLLSLRKKYEFNGKSKINITENNLLEVKHGKLIGYFNISSNALGFNSTSKWIQNYLVGQLLPKGVVIKEEEE
ncbi:MAG: hypothetical protein HDR42_02910 [Lactobacillus sp.]|nr:hypothetical protein [Lactobacillus sp.]